MSDIDAKNFRMLKRKIGSFLWHIRYYQQEGHDTLRESLSILSNWLIFK